MKTKYKDQDDEDREMVMQYLAVINIKLLKFFILNKKNALDNKKI